MNVPLVIAGAIGVLAAAVHGGAGEVLVVRKLSLDRLAPSPFGGPRMTKAMIHVTWHITTVAFLVIGVALILSGTALHGDARHATAVLAATAWTGFAAIAMVLGVGYMRTPRTLLRHPGPIAISAVAALAWLGAF